MEATPGIVFEKSLVRFLVMPGFKRGTGFHGGKNMHKAGMTTSFGNNLRNAIVLAEVLLADELNFKFIFAGNGLCVFINLVSHGRGPFFKIENLDAGSKKEVCNRSWVANVR
jgi:hypothetical protein